MTLAAEKFLLDNFPTNLMTHHATRPSGVILAWPNTVCLFFFPGESETRRCLPDHQVRLRPPL